MLRVGLDRRYPLSIAEAEAAPVRVLIHADTIIDIWDRMERLDRAHTEAMHAARRR